MWHIRIAIDGHGHHSELIGDDPEIAELFVEQQVGLLLQEIFEMVVIKAVSVHHTPSQALEEIVLPDHL